MAIYIGLVFYVLCLPLAFYFFNPNGKNNNKYIAFFGMLGVFLVLALKAPSVGTDIVGYREQYYIAKQMSWSNFDYVYFESGYIFLEKVFSKLGVSFQLFTVLIYAFSSFAWYKLIAKYSKDSCISVLFFICYQFFVFSASGLRQVIAMAICIFAFILFNRFDVKGIVLGFVLYPLAILFHMSAYIFAFVLIGVAVSRKVKKIRILSAIALVPGAFILRGTVWSFINSNLKKIDVGSSVSLGGAFLFQLIIFAFIAFTFYFYYKDKNAYGLKLVSGDCILYEDVCALRLSLYSIVVYIMFSGSVILRSSMYVMMFVVAFLPRMVAKYNCKSRMIINLVLIVVLIYIFYSQTLSINQFEICPYKFFWE